MRIRMKTTYASPRRTCPAGKVLQVDLPEARSLIAAGYAEAVDPLPAATPAAAPAAEGAAPLPAKESPAAALPRRRGRGD